MSLKWFHILFITVSVLLCWGFGVWCIAVKGTAQYMTLGVVCLLLGVALIVYGVKFYQKIKKTNP